MADPETILFIFSSSLFFIFLFLCIPTFINLFLAPRFRLQDTSLFCTKELWVEQNTLSKSILSSDFADASLEKLAVSVPKVSVLIPCRNEEKNISNLLDDLLKQTWKNYEVLILDDNSTDGTVQVVQNKIAEIEKADKVNKTKEFNKINKPNKNITYKLFHGKKLKNGWLGKNWACNQLAKNATGSVLCFIDADVRIKPGTLETTVNEIIENNLNMLSVFPTQKMPTLQEKIVVPFMNWILITFLPLHLVYFSKRKSLAAANGQFIAFKTDFYIKFGGHRAVKDKVVEDIEFVRLIKSIMLRQVLQPDMQSKPCMHSTVKTYLDGGLVSCRMYSNLLEAQEGFAKNIYLGAPIKGVHYTLLVLAIAFFWFVVPVFLFLTSIILFYNYVGIFLLQRVTVSLISRQNVVHNLILSPLHIIYFSFLMFYSLYRTKCTTLYWKNRKISFFT